MAVGKLGAPDLLSNIYLYCGCLAYKHPRAKSYEEEVLFIDCEGISSQDLVLKHVALAREINGENCPNVAVSVQSDHDFLPREIGRLNISAEHFGEGTGRHATPPNAEQRWLRTQISMRIAQSNIVSILAHC